MKSGRAIKPRASFEARLEWSKGARMRSAADMFHFPMDLPTDVQLVSRERIESISQGANTFDTKIDFKYLWRHR